MYLLDGIMASPSWSETIPVWLKYRLPFWCNRSGSENLTLAIQSPHSIPYRHGNTACHTPRHVGTAPARSASLYSGTESACGGIGGHGAGVTRAQPRMAGAAVPDLTARLASPVERPAPQRAATSPSE